jgi:hypothetical protein
VTRQKLMTLLEEYGRVAIYTYLVIWLATWAGFATAISLGFAIKSAQGGVGLLGASWVATKLTQPLRIAATLAVTPLVATAIKKLRGRSGATPVEAPPPPEA